MTGTDPTGRGHVCVAECRPNAHVAFRGREAATAEFLAAPDLEAARRDTHYAHERYSAAVSFDGGPAGEEEVAIVLHAAFPNLRFAASDVEGDDPATGVWLVPVPRTVALIVDHGGHFEWSDALWLRADAVGFDVGITIESSL